MTGALPECPPPARVTRLLDLAARVLGARDRLTAARDAVGSSPTRSRALAAAWDVLDAEVRGLDGILSGLYRLVELAEDTWDELDAPGADPGGPAAEPLTRAVDHALDDLGRLSGLLRSLEPVDTRATVAGWAGADPDAVYEKVAALPTASRRVLALAEPEAVGDTHGVPWRVRAMANAVRVRRTLHREQLAGTPWSPRIGRLETMLRRAPEPTPGEGPRPLVRRSFVGYSTERTGRMVEVVGSVGPHTDAVAVYVPGTGTNLDMSHVNTDVAVDLVSASGGRLAVVVFLDGEFPQDIMRDAAEARFAERMAPRLVRFCREVDRVIELECPGAALTVAGHSYGGRIVGYAERLGLRADRVVYAEAPDLGHGVTGASELRNPAPVRRFTLTAPADPVELMQLRAGMRRPWSVSDLADVGVRLDTGRFADGEPVFGTRGHGGVFDRGCGAFDAMLAVMLGGEVPLWRDREIVARHVRVRLGTDGRTWPAVWRALVGLGLRRGDSPYSAPRVTWEAPPRTVTVPESDRARLRRRGDL